MTSWRTTNRLTNVAPSARRTRIEEVFGRPAGTGLRWTGDAHQDLRVVTTNELVLVGELALGRS